jgi:CRP-like cAMP-binding protein
VVAGLILLGYYAWMPRPIWAAIVWNILFSVINARQIGILLRERRPPQLRPDEQFLHEIAFRRLTDREFAKLLSIGEWRDLGAGEHLVRRGEAIQQLIVLASGRVRVDLDGKSRFQLRAGCFVGETSFLTGRVPDAEVVAMEPTRTLGWQDEQLQKLLARDAELRAALQQVLGEDLVAKLRPA